MMFRRIVLAGMIPVLLFLPGIQSCKNKTEEFTAKGMEYFNYAPGQLREYDFDSSAWEWISGKLLKYHFLVKERVLDTFTDLTGRKALRIEQYISRDTGITYKFYSLQSVFSDEYGCQRVQNNQRYLKLSLPVTLKKKWNGNIYNGLGAQDFRYTAVGKTFANVYLSNTNCVDVTEQDDTTLISRDYRLATYAKNMGLIQYYHKSIQYDNKGLPQGFIVTWNLRRILM